MTPTGRRPADDGLPSVRRMNVLRTPDERFADLPDYPFGPHYVDVGAADARLRMHYVDEGSGRPSCCCTASPPGPTCTGTPWRR